ncbi:MULTISPECIES: hypothetical protein [unclassified Leifsonia]|uniref:hypothetical protein n=1 Tax=unclassified Leifsonia TaxID=2663824 RepID=UPI000B02ECFD|nr:MULTISPECIES: hypothetical protein [unclassified Leifsonia]
MKIELIGVSKGRNGSSLPETTVRFETDVATLARAETERRPTVLGLMASGRMRPDTGRVLIDGVADNAALRTRVALVDAPDVSDPAADVTVTGVVMEELMFAGLPGSRRDAMLTLAQLELGDYARTSMADLPPSVRVRLLTELAVLRDGVEGLVIAAPDRHGGDPLEWWRIARALAARGYAVLVIAGDASAAAIGAEGLLARLESEAQPIEPPPSEPRVPESPTAGSPTSDSPTPESRPTESRPTEGGAA